MTNKKISPFTIASLASFNLLLYLFFISKYIQNETAQIAIVVPLYLLMFTLSILTYLFVKNIESRKIQLLFSLMILCIQLGFGVFLTIVWFQSRNSNVLSHPIWLTHLRILTQLHYFSGITLLLRCFFQTL